MSFYGNATDYKAYHAARGRDESARDDADVNVALLVASEWLDGSFGHRWPGHKVASTATQERDWPRSWVEDRDGFPVSSTSVPIEVERATYEAAYRELAESGSLVTDYTPHKYSEVSIEGALRVKYRALDAATVQKQFPAIGNALARIMGGAGNVSSLSIGSVRA